VPIVLFIDRFINDEDNNKNGLPYGEILPRYINVLQIQPDEPGLQMKGYKINCNGKWKTWQV